MVYWHMSREQSWLATCLCQDSSPSCANHFVEVIHPKYKFAPMQAEARRFLAALGRRATESGNSFSVHQLFDLSDHLQLKVPDMRQFIEQLNDAGMLKYLPCDLKHLSNAGAVCVSSRGAASFVQFNLVNAYDLQVSF